MSAHGLTVFVILTLAAMVMVTYWRKVLMLVLSVAIAVFLFGLFYAVDLVRT